MRKVMIFGVFEDAKNYTPFLRRAREEGEYLIVVVMQDHIVRHLFGHEPKINFIERFEKLCRTGGIQKVVMGGGNASLVNLVRRYRPDAVLFAADQKLLREDLVDGLAKDAHKPIIRAVDEVETTHTP